MVGSINEKEVHTSTSPEVVVDSKDDRALSLESFNNPMDHHDGAPVANEKDIDKAYIYMNTHSEGGVDAEADAIDLVALRRKVDWRIVPIMFACYTMQFIDKVMINVSISRSEDHM